ncbi:hypothetical protein [Malaciobacter molluscorum]|nr:hypothetical protein [Malaciobacter molluscorum]
MNNMLNVKYYYQKDISESSNTITNYGFDVITQIPEFNAGLCRIERA